MFNIKDRKITKGNDIIVSGRLIVANIVSPFFLVKYIILHIHNKIGEILPIKKRTSLINQWYMLKPLYIGKSYAISNK